MIGQLRAPLPVSARFGRAPPGKDTLTKEGSVMSFLLWILAVILVIAGIVSLVRGQILWGIVLIIVGLLVGPGGVSIFT
jgi:hypothetical protein